ncbi:MAG: M1 family aminopeptidase [Bacteroidota bacterium]
MRKVQSNLNDLYANYDVKYYRLDINLEADTSYISGRADMTFLVVGNSMDTLVVELLAQISIDSLKINGVNKSFTRLGDSVFILFSPLPAMGEYMQLSTWYHGSPPTSGFFTGLNSAYFPEWQSHVTWSLSQPWMAKEWWPCKQDLKDKADSSSVIVTTSNTNKVGSNGLLFSVDSLPGNKVRYEWKSKNPIDFYLISVAVGPFMDYSIYAKPEGLNDSILIQNYLFNVPGCLQQYQANIDKTPSYLELFSKLIGLYPFWKEKYGHCMAYLGGAMEHQTMTTTGDFGPDLISHELFHQWFGDHVSCATWNDIWINEGFATYGSYLGRQYVENQQSADAFMYGVHDVVLSVPDGSVYIPDSQVNDINRIFDGRLSYNKGAAIIHMLRFEMKNDSLFFNTLKGFQQQYSNSTASGLDFKDYAANFSGLNLDDFFNQWYFGEGYPTYFINYLKVGDSLFLRSAQAPSSVVTSLFKMSLELKIVYPGGDTTIRFYQDQAMQYFKIPFTRQVSWLVLDPAGWCLLKVGGIQEGLEVTSDLVEFKIFPNPASDILQIDFLTNKPEMHTYLITDVSGRMIRSFSSEASRLEMNIENLAKGIYFLQTNWQSSTIRRKFIKG